MNEHLLQQQIEDYQLSRLAPVDLIAVDDHLVTCAACRGRVEAALRTTFVSLYDDLRAAAEAHQIPDSPPHPTFERLAAYIDDAPPKDERQFITDHLATCAQCAGTVADLRAFKAEAAMQPPERSDRGWWNKVREMFRPSAPAFKLAFSALLLIVVAGWLIRLAFDKKSPAPQVADHGAQPTVAPLLKSAPEAAPLMAQLNDAGGQITLDQQGKLTGLDGAPPAYQRMVKEALTTQRLTIPGELSDLDRRGSSLMGADERGNQFSLLAPAGKVVLTDRPAFKWTPLTGAASYVVEIYDERFTLVMNSRELRNNKWTPSQRLARGQLYSWQVKASKDGREVVAPRPPALQARFRVAPQAQADEIAAWRRAHGNSHLTMALLYAQAGLLDEAERELRALQTANPDAAIVRRLLANVRARR